MKEFSFFPSRHHHNEEIKNYTMLINKKYKYYIQFDQHTKCRWCANWEQAVSWYGKRLSIVPCVLTNDICVGVDRFFVLFSSRLFLRDPIIGCIFILSKGAMEWITLSHLVLVFEVLPVYLLRYVKHFILSIGFIWCFN
jgi:hypothetical protein